MFNNSRQIVRQFLPRRVTAQPSLKEFAMPNRRDFMLKSAAFGLAALVPKWARSQDPLPPAPVPMPDDQPNEPRRLARLVITDETMFKRPLPTKNVRPQLVKAFDELNSDVKSVWAGMKVLYDLHEEGFEVIDQLKRSQQEVKATIDELWKGLDEHRKQIDELLAYCLKVKDFIDRMGKELCKTQGMLDQLQCMIQQALCMACGLGDRIRKARMVSFLFGLALGVGIGIGVGGGGGAVASSVSVW